MKSGNLNLLEPCSPFQACNGTALPIPLPLPMLSQMNSVQIIIHTPLLSHILILSSLLLVVCALQVIGIHFHSSSQPRPAYQMSLKVLQDVTFTKSCVLSSSPALRYFVRFRYCSQRLVFRTFSFFFLALGREIRFTVMQNKK